MRKHEIGCRHLNLFVASSRFKENKFFKSGGYSFDSLTNSTLNISQCASLTLESIFKSEVEYKQMGICFLGLEKLASNQLPFNSNLYTKNSENLMKALDKINNQYHSEMVRTASSMSSSSKKENKSVKIWNSIPEIQID